VTEVSVALRRRPITSQRSRRYLPSRESSGADTKSCDIKQQNVITQVLNSRTPLYQHPAATAASSACSEHRTSAHLLQPAGGSPTVGARSAGRHWKKFGQNRDFQGISTRAARGVLTVIVTLCSEGGRSGGEGRGRRRAEGAAGWWRHGRAACERAAAASHGLRNGPRAGALLILTPPTACLSPLFLPLLLLVRLRTGAPSTV